MATRLVGMSAVTEVRRVAGRGLHQGQERNPSGASAWRTKAELRGAELWARGYFVSTVGRNETTIREYIRNQEKEDQRIDQFMAMHPG